MIVDDLLLVITTLPDRNSAEEMAKRLVEDNLGACVSVVPDLKSFFRWKGQVEEASEFLLIIKTRDYEKLEKAVLDLHPYEVPELIALRADEAYSKYYEWICNGSCQTQESGLS